MNYYILSEDMYSPDSMELGEIPESIDKRAIATMELQFLNQEPVELELLNGLTDISTYKYPIISEKIKDIFDSEEVIGVFYKPIILVDKESNNYLYYLMLPKKIDCLSYNESGINREETLRIKAPFYLKDGAIGNMKVFGIEGILNRLVIITQDIKELLEKEELRGIKIVNIRDYNGA